MPGLLPIWKAISVPLPYRMTNDRNIDPTLIALAAVLEPGSVVGYKPNNSSDHAFAVDHPVAIVWDIHTWGVRCVSESESSLLSIQWKDLCAPF